MLKGCFLFRGLGTVSVSPLVEQSLSFIVNYKEYVGSDEAHSTAIDPSNSLLPFQSPRVRILLPKGFGREGLGSKWLTHNKILTTWDTPHSAFPAICRPSFHLTSDLVPLKVLLALSDAVLSLLDIHEVSLGLQRLPTLPSSTLDPRGIYLLSLNCWLSCKWIDTSLIAEFVKKKDDATVPTHI